MSDTVPDLLAALIRSVDAARAERKSRTHRRTNHQGDPMSETPTAEKDAGCPACGGDNLAAMLGSVWCNECDWIDPPERPIPPEEPCRCIAAGRGGVHYPSDHARRPIPPGSGDTP